MIEFQSLVKEFGNHRVLDGVSFRIEAGESVVILGPSGVGKSVLLKHLVGLLRPTSGVVTFEGAIVSKMSPRELNALRRSVGMLFQDGALLDSLSVFENIAFPLRHHGSLSEAEIRDRVVDLLNRVGLPGTEAKMPADLSGGMRKRVGLARALVMKPKLLLFDEPTSGLDPVMAEAIDQLIVHTIQAAHVTSLVITHDIQSALAIADKIGLLYDSRLISFDTPRNVLASGHPTLRHFFQRYRRSQE